MHDPHDHRPVLVTGALGFSGAHVVKELLAAGHGVVGTDTTRSLAAGSAPRAAAAAIGLDLDHPRLSLRSADLLEPDSLAPLFEARPKWVMHTASLYDYSASLERLRAVNVEGTRDLLRLAVEADLDRFVHWSTCGVFGKPFTARHGARVNVPFSEASPSPKSAPEGATGPTGTELVNPYSVSKWEQEQLVWRAARADGLPLTVVRPAPVYGPGLGATYGHGGIVLAIAQGLVPAIPRDARHFITTSVHVADLARFAVFAAALPEALGEDYNVIDDSVISYWDFLMYIGLLTGRRVRGLPWIRMETLRPAMVAAAHAWRWLERRTGLPRVRVFEVQSATYMSSSYWIANDKMKATGFTLRYPDVREGLRETVAWLRDTGALTRRGALFAASRGGSKGPTGPAKSA